ncbi:hypothetical protein BX661DRAFT_183912 [Kickxella alabastrina]|nr:uncharacterized protein BX661DRAFT_183899 [Kickxella alabastrina]XP_051391032.1 uncharacterized protein BX661DRAFT_183912 [Kickxella alabastrina]KAI7826374.1 hypothetical protein BX661DRAFT_183899 [Kickxella alabastrina]KAI7826376.1 hypothetical protein BX661DRAFT_183912 [Kickxella alabastrina]
MEYTTSDRGYHLPPLDFSITNPSLAKSTLSTSNPLSSYNQPLSSYFVSSLPTPPFAATRPPC